MNLLLMNPAQIATVKLIPLEEAASTSFVYTWSGKLLRTGVHSPKRGSGGPLFIGILHRLPFRSMGKVFLSDHQQLTTTLRISDNLCVWGWCVPESDGHCYHNPGLC